MPDRRDPGFTLVELLVVVAVVGILAAIAVPTFLGQRQRAVEASVESDLRQVAQLMETYYVDRGEYAGDMAVLEAAIPPPTQLSGGNSVELVPAFTGSSSYCLIGRNDRSRDFYVDSDGGGLLQPGVPCT